MDSLQWQSFLKSCLDILRNGKSGYDGLKAINEFITLITLKLVEHRIYELDETKSSDDEKIRIGLDCKFKYLYENYCIYKTAEEENTKAFELFDILYNCDRIWDIEDELDDNLNHIGQVRKRNNKNECIIHRFNKYTKNLSKLADNINDVKTLTSFTKEHSSDVQKLVIKIHDAFGIIDMEHFTYDAFGNAYEKMLTDELGNTAKRGGQHFTKRDLIKYIIKELNIKDTDLCYDPACGTGGFLLGFASLFKNNHKFIENNIYGQEYLDEVYKTLNFNILANNLDKSLQNITKGDSIRLQDYHEKVKNKFDKVGANPPFGMSISSCPSEYPINKIKNSVALFLQHIYFSLKDGGQAGIIIDRGILNNGTDKKNSWEKKIRKFLLENTSITKIINLPTGIFKHTNFATSVIFFTKGIPTKEIKYIEGYFKVEDKGKGDKPMYLGEEKILKIKDIISKDYSLKYDDFFKIDIGNPQDTSKWVKLGDVVEIQFGTRITKGKNEVDKNHPNAYPVYGGGDITFYTDNFNREGETIIISRFGVSQKCVRVINGKIFLNDSAMSIKTKNIMDLSFIKYYLLLNQINIFNNYTSGQGQQNTETEKLKKEFLIPNLTLPHQEEIVKFLDEVYETVKIEDTVKYLKDKPIFNLLIDRNYDGFKDIIYFQENIPKLIYELENIPKKKNLQIQSIFQSYRSKCEVKKLGDVIEILNYKPVKIENADENGKYPFYNCSILGHLWSNEYLYEDEILIMNKTNGSGKCNIYYNNGKFSISGGVVIFKPLNTLKIIYLHKYLLSIINIISNNFVGGDKKNLNMEGFKNIQIPIPPLQIQEEIIKKIEALDTSASHYNEYSKMLEKELSNITDIINNMTTLNKSNDIPLDNAINNKSNNIIILDDVVDNNDKTSEDILDEDSEEESEYDEIKIKDKIYILEDEQVYVKTDEGLKGKLYGYYKNDKFTKIKKVKSNEATT